MSDVAEAYCTIPLHPSQWPTLIVCIADEPTLFTVDMCLCFSYGRSAWTYGTIHDAVLDVLQAAGVGPVITWVDDHLFICLPQNAIADYHKLCQTKAQAIVVTRVA